MVMYGFLNVCSFAMSQYSVYSVQFYMCCVGVIQMELDKDLAFYFMGSSI